MSLDGPIDPPEPPDVYAHACRPCRQGRCEDCAALGRCACCDTDPGEALLRSIFEAQEDE